MLSKLKELPSDKIKKYALIAVVAAAILLIYFSTLYDKTSAEDETTPQTENAQELEKRMEDALKRVEGAGEVSVVINYESTSELVPATKTDLSEQQSSSDGKSQNSESKSEDIAQVSGNVVILKEKQPKVRGVMVVAKGAKDIRVKNDILFAVMTLLDVTADKVEILY